MDAHSGHRRRTAALVLALLLGGCAIDSAPPDDPGGPTDRPDGIVADPVSVRADLPFSLQPIALTVILDPPPVEAEVAAPVRFELAAAAPSPNAGPGTTVSVYLAPAPAGDDRHGGRSPADPVASLVRAQVVARESAGANIDLRIRAGDYRLAGTSWTLAAPGRRIRFLPESEVDGVAVTTEARPRFIGDGLAGPYWLDIVASTAGGSTAFDVRNLQVSGYANGLRISTGYDNKPGPAPGRLATGVGDQLRAAVVTGMAFTRIGSAFASTTGFAAVHLQNTAGAIVRGNSFDLIENDAQTRALVHGVYAVISTDLEISGNRLDRVSGDAIRTRHGSSGSVTGNSIDRSGAHAGVSDWFCGKKCAAKADTAVECPGGMLVVQGNLIGSAFSGRPLPEFARTVDASQAGNSCP